MDALLLADMNVYKPWELDISAIPCELILRFFRTLLSKIVEVVRVHCSNHPVTCRSMDVVQHETTSGGHHIEITCIYYPPEVGSMKYCCLGVLEKEYFMLVTK